MRRHSRGWRIQAGLSVLGSGAFLFQGLGGCNLGTISTTTTSTLDARQVLIDLLRGAILTPIDAAITSAVTNLVGGNDEE